MTAICIQDKLKLKTKRDDRQLLDLQGAVREAGEDTDLSDILDDLTRGPSDPHRIDWAWDIAGKGADKREIRILALCVLNRAARFSFMDALLTIFPEQKTLMFKHRTWSATQLSKRLGCTPDHVLHLCADGSLSELPNTRKKGRNGSPAVTWQSIRTFLETRRIS